MRVFIVSISILLLLSEKSYSENVIGAEALDNLRGKKILLAGATGKNGRHILYLLSELGLEFYPTSRDILKAKKKFGENFNWIEADVTKPQSLKRALEEIDIVISAVATMMPFGKNRSEQVDFYGTKNLLKFSKESGVTRFIIITSSSSGVKDHFLNKFFNNMLIWKAEAEKILVNSGLEYVVVCPSVINDNLGRLKSIRLIPRPLYQAGMEIGREDLASVVVAAAGHPDARNRVFTVVNEEKKYSNLWLSTFKDLPKSLNHPK